jgi:hypothetical protein
MVLMMLAAVVFLRGESGAVALNHGGALSGVMTANVYFDVNIGDPAKLRTRLQLIETTYSQLVATGFSPRVVIGIRGMASNFFTRDAGYVPEAELPVKKELAAKVEKFKAMGFAVEQCRIAAGMQGIDVADFLPQVQIVDNGYVSMIGYQAQGYAYGPMD